MNNSETPGRHKEKEKNKGKGKRNRIGKMRKQGLSSRNSRRIKDGRIS